MTHMETNVIHILFHLMKDFVNKHLKLMRHALRSNPCNSVLQESNVPMSLVCAKHHLKYNYKQAMSVTILHPILSQESVRTLGVICSALETANLFFQMPKLVNGMKVVHLDTVILNSVSAQKIQFALNNFIYQYFT